MLAPCFVRPALYWIGHSYFDVSYPQEKLQLMKFLNLELKFLKITILAIFCLYIVIAIPCMMIVMQRISEIMNHIKDIQSKRSFQYPCFQICQGYNYQNGEEPICCQESTYDVCKTKRECKLALIELYQQEKAEENNALNKQFCMFVVVLLCIIVYFVLQYRAQIKKIWRLSDTQVEQKNGSPVWYEMNEIRAMQTPLLKAPQIKLHKLSQK